MGLPIGFPMFLMFLGLFVLALLVITAVQSRRHAALTQPRLCRRCAGPNPSHARYCRRCGQPLQG